jgi:hypothetical protein
MITVIREIMQSEIIFHFMYSVNFSSFEDNVPSDFKSICINVLSNKKYLIASKIMVYYYQFIRNILHNWFVFSNKYFERLKNIKTTNVFGRLIASKVYVNNPS